MTGYPDSYYAATAHPAPARPALVGEAVAEVCIVGAGFTGLSAALELAERGHRVAVLGAALEGIERQIEPPAPGRTAETLPMDWKQAIDAFEESDAMARVFAPILRETFVGMKKQELQVFSQQISPFEHETYLETV